MKRIVAVWSCILLIYGCVSYEGNTEEVSFVGAGGVNLRGTIAFPEGVTTPVPAIILLHGAERAERTRFVYPMLANVFLARGMAVLVYDKRGAGESGGIHEETTFAQLIGDAKAAVDLLRQRQDIDPAKIGIFGVSQSGWLTPEIAETSGNIAYVINKVGPAQSWRDTVAWETYNELLDSGASEQSAGEQVEIYRRIWDYQISPSPEERTALEGILASWADDEASGLPAELEEVNAIRLANMSYDPTPFLERLKVPMLYLYGGQDVNVPAEANVARLTELAAGGKPVSFHVYESAGHELATFGLLPPWYQFLDGYAELLGDFAEKHTGG